LVTPGNSWILNDEDFAEDQDLDFRATFGYNAGFTLGLNLTDGFGIASGFIYNKVGQNYITGYDGRTRDEQNTFSRELEYIRIPVLLKVNGSVDASASAFFRIGPHFDFLKSANYTYNINGGLGSGNTIKQDMRDYRGILGTNSTPQEIYKKMVVGLTIEMGGQINVTKTMKIIMALHLEGSITPTEGKDAKNVYPSSGTFLQPERAKAWNVMAGLTIGLNYVFSFD
jgi:hypothetical protein